MKNEIKILKAISESTRLRIMYLLLRTKKEVCGCELVDSLELPQYNLTRHLDILVNADLVKSRKEGRWVYYSSCKDETSFCVSLCQLILKVDDEIYQMDIERFKQRADMRVEGKCCVGIQNNKFN